MVLRGMVGWWCVCVCVCAFLRGIGVDLDGFAIVVRTLLERFFGISPSIDFSSPSVDFNSPRLDFSSPNVDFNAPP